MIFFGHEKMYILAGETDLQVNLEKAKIMTRAVQPMNTNNEMKTLWMKYTQLVRYEEIRDCLE